MPAGGLHPRALAPKPSLREMGCDARVTRSENFYARFKSSASFFFISSFVCAASVSFTFDIFFFFFFEALASSNRKVLVRRPRLFKQIPRGSRDRYFRCEKTWKAREFESLLCKCKRISLKIPSVSSEELNSSKFRGLLGSSRSLARAPPFRCKSESTRFILQQQQQYI